MWREGSEEANGTETPKTRRNRDLRIFGCAVSRAVNRNSGAVSRGIKQSSSFSFSAASASCCCLVVASQPTTTFFTAFTTAASARSVISPEDLLSSCACVCVCLLYFTLLPTPQPTPASGAWLFLVLRVAYVARLRSTSPSRKASGAPFAEAERRASESALLVSSSSSHPRPPTASSPRLRPRPLPLAPSRSSFIVALVHSFVPRLSASRVHRYAVIHQQLEHTPRSSSSPRFSFTHTQHVGRQEGQAAEQRHWRYGQDLRGRAAGRVHVAHHQAHDRWCVSPIHMSSLLPPLSRWLCATNETRPLAA